MRIPRSGRPRVAQESKVLLPLINCKPVDDPNNTPQVELKVELHLPQSQVSNCSTCSGDLLNLVVFCV